MRNALKLLLLVVVLAAVGSAGQMPASQSAAGMLMSTQTLAAHLKDGNLVILHVGTAPGTYESQHITGARFLSLSDIAVNRNGIPNELPPAAQLKKVFERLGVGDHSRIVLYGENSGMLATRAYFTLEYLGHGRNIALLDGGIEAWAAERRPISSGPAASARPAVLTVNIQPEVLVDLPAIKQIVAGRKLPLIDARPQASWYAGHIPGARNVFWGDNLTSQARPTLKSIADIRSRYIAAGLKPGSKVIVYCQSGMQATHDYFTLKLAGFTPVLYDGSFSEWNSSRNPVETGAAGPR